jgi:hypothetical protein
MNDAVDPCPNAAPHTDRSDTEKIIAACIDAYFFGNAEIGWPRSTTMPAVLEEASIKPFELYGYPSMLLWEDARKPSALRRCWGVKRIHFAYPILTAKGKDRTKEELEVLERAQAKAKTVIEFGPERRTARTYINTYGDYIDMRLRKISAEWFVVDMTRAPLPIP